MSSAYIDFRVTFADPLLEPPPTSTVMASASAQESSIVPPMSGRPSRVRRPARRRAPRTELPSLLSPGPWSWLPR